MSETELELKLRALAYYDRAAVEWDHAQIVRDRLPVIASLADLWPSSFTGRILDVGCGGGEITRHLGRKYPSARVVGLDFSPRMIEVACQLTSDAQTNVHFVCGDFESWRAHEPFNLILLCDSLEHMYSPGRAVEQVHSLLVPKGYVVVTMPHPEYRKAHGMEEQPIDHAIELDWLQEQMGALNLYLEREVGFGNDWGSYTTYWGGLFHHRA